VREGSDAVLLWHILLDLLRNWHVGSSQFSIEYYYTRSSIHNSINPKSAVCNFRAASGIKQNCSNFYKFDFLKGQVRY